MNQNPESTIELFDSMARLAQEKTPLFSSIWERSREEFGDSWVAEVVDSVVHLFGVEKGSSWESALVGYAEFALDGMKDQKYFELNDRYRWSTLKEIQERYYENETHMMDNYLPGIYLSHYLWPHHYKLLKFFSDTVLSNLDPSPEIFYDVGIGPGLYSREVLKAFPKVRGNGCDISRYSIAFTSKVLESYGLRDRYDFVLTNIFDAELPWGTADFVVSQEVLEHLENPAEFSRILYRLVKPGGKAYITAAVNAALSDHIYLFRSAQEVEKMLVGVGWQILDSQVEYAYSGSPIPITPCVAGFMCQR